MFLISQNLLNAYANLCSSVKLSQSTNLIEQRQE